MKNRERQRANRKVKEQMLSLKDTCGVCDPTPYEATRELINEFKRNKMSFLYNIWRDQKRMAGEPRDSKIMLKTSKKLPK